MKCFCHLLVKPKFAPKESVGFFFRGVRCLAVVKGRLVLSTQLCKEGETFSQELVLLNHNALDNALGHLWPDPRSAGQFYMHRCIKIPLTNLRALITQC